MVAMLAALFVLGSFSPAAAQRPRILDVPSVIEFDVCVLPGEACTDRRDVADLVVGARSVQAAITDVRVITGSRTSGEVRSDLGFGPQRVFGPKELLARFEPGARLHVRATNRRGSRELFVQGVEPPGEATGGAAKPPPRP
jgi:hypothetical protein